MPQVDASRRRLGTALGVLLISLGSLVETPRWSLAAEEDPRAKREWDALRDALDGELGRLAPRIARVDTARVASTGGTSREWTSGPERNAMRQAGAALQKNIRRIDASLAAVAEAAAAMSAAVEDSGVSQKLARSEDAAREAEERLRARWERERAGREREREQREREAGERARSRP